MNFKESLGLKNEFLIVHSGNMGVKQGLNVILEAAHLCQDDRSLHYLLVGDGAVRQELQDKAGAMKLNNLQFLPLLPDEQFKELLAATDVSLITQQKCVADIVFPSKVITIMAAGRAIVASVSEGSEIARVFNEARAGLVVPAEEPASLLTAITILRDNDSLRHGFAHNAREFARQNWNRDLILASMESQLNSLFAKPAAKKEQSRRIWNFARPNRSRAMGSIAAK
jgi:colanic acid biosynthesis glycosyl transferase WcaI